MTRRSTGGHRGRMACSSGGAGRGSSGVRSRYRRGLLEVPRPRPVGRDSIDEARLRPHLRERARLEQRQAEVFAGEFARAAEEGVDNSRRPRGRFRPGMIGCGCGVCRWLVPPRGCSRALTLFGRRSGGARAGGARDRLMAQKRHASVLRHARLAAVEPVSARLVDGSVRVGCAFCDFAARGTVEETREAFAEHVCDRPRPTETKRRRGGFSACSSQRFCSAGGRAATSR